MNTLLPFAFAFALAVVPACSLFQPTCDPVTAVGGVRLSLGVEANAAPEWQEQTLSALSQRLRASGSRCFDLARDKDGLRLDLPSADAERYGEAFDTLLAPNRLSLYIEADDNKQRTANAALRDAARPTWIQGHHIGRITVHPGTSRAEVDAWVASVGFADEVMVRWEQGKSGWVLRLLDPKAGGEVNIAASAPGDSPMPGLTSTVLSFDAAGEALLTRLTTDHTKERMAMLVDDNVISMPVIAEPIPGGRATLTHASRGSFSDRLFAESLSHPMPVRLIVMSTQALDPAL